MTKYIDKDGFTNRKISKLPNEKLIIDIIVPRAAGEEIYKCEWIPYNSEDYKVQPAIGFLGTTTVISGKYSGIGFHVWDQNDAEFIYYKISNQY